MRVIFLYPALIALEFILIQSNYANVHLLVLQIVRTGKFVLSVDCHLLAQHA